MRRRLLLLLPALWFVALLSAPAVAYVAGKRQPLLENREKEPFPPINRSSLQSAEVFGRIDRAILDRLPLRGDALTLKSRIALRWFGVSPSPEVTPGTGGWLYFWRDFRVCMPSNGTDVDPADAAEIIARTVGASGRRVGVVVTSSKTGKQPEHLRSDADKKLARCVAEREARVHERLRTTPGGIDLTPALDRELAAGRDVFLKRDTHWEGNAQLIFARAMLDAVRPGLAKEAELEQVTKPIKRQADLTFIAGMPADQDTYPPVARRPVTFPDAKPGDTFMLGDSQMRLAMTDTFPGRPPISTTALPGAVYCDRGSFPNDTCNAQLAASRNVLFEWVGRDMADITGICVQFPSVLLGDLRKRLTPRPAPLVDVQGGRRHSSGLRPGTAPMTVRFAPAGGDVASSLRLMVVPVERLGTPQAGGPEQVSAVQKPTDGKPIVACATPTAGADSAIILPVPAGRSAADLGLEITAPPGTVLGRPVAYTLDDATVERGMRDALAR